MPPQAPVPNPEAARVAGAAATQLEQNHPTEALQVVDRFLTESLRANANNPAAQLQAFQSMTQALEQRGILPRIMADSIGPANSPFFRSIDANNNQRIETAEAAAFANNPNRWQNSNTVQIMSMMWLATHMDGIAGRPNGSVTPGDLLNWANRAAGAAGPTPEVAAANRRLTNPPENYFSSPAEMANIRTATDTLRNAGALHAIENGKPGATPELVAEYARTHYTELADRASGKITLDSINAYLNANRQPPLTDFARGLVTQMRDRFDAIATASGDAPRFRFGFGSNGSITLNGIESWRAGIQPARESAEFLATQEGRALFGDTNNPPHFTRARAAQVVAEQNAIANNANLPAEQRETAARMARIGGFIEAQVARNGLLGIGPNAWGDQYVCYNTGNHDIMSSATTAGYLPNDVSITQTPPRPGQVGNANIQQPAPIGNGVMQQPAPVGNQGIQQPAPIGNQGIGQPAPIGNQGIGQPAPPAPNPFEQMGAPQRAEWNRPGTPERQLMDQTIALLQRPGALDVAGLTRLLNAQPETMERIKDEVNQELEQMHSNRRLSWVTNYNADGGQVRMLSVMREATPGSGSWSNEGTAMAGRLDRPATTTDATTPVTRTAFNATQYSEAAQAAARANQPLFVVVGDPRDPGYRAMRDGVNTGLRINNGTYLFADRGQIDANTPLGRLVAANLANRGGIGTIGFNVTEGQDGYLHPGTPSIYDVTTNVDPNRPRPLRPQIAEVQAPAASQYVQPAQQEYYYPGQCNGGSCGGNYSNVVPFMQRGPVRRFISRR